MREIFLVVFQAYRESILPLRLLPLQASRDVRNQTRCVVCRPNVLVRGPRFLPHLPPSFLSQQYVPGHRFRLIARSLHWINRMPSDQGSQKCFFAPPSLVSYHIALVTAAVKGAQASFPASPPSTPKAYCVMPVDITKCSLFKGEDTPDRANSVDRSRRLCSPLILHLAIPLLPL